MKRICLLLFFVICSACFGISVCSGAAPSSSSPSSGFRYDPATNTSTATGNVSVPNGSLSMGTSYSRMPIVTSAGNVTLTADQQKGCIVEITAAGTVSLLAGTVGDTVTVYATGAFAVSVDPNGTQVITLNGVDLAGGNKITSTSTAGDSVTLYFNGTKWRVIGGSAWTDGGA